MKTADILIIGSGSLVQGVINGLSQMRSGPLRIAVIGRSLAKVSQLTLIANARSAILGSSATFVPVEITQFKASAFSRVFRSLKPKVIFHAASLQSPWEAAEKQSAWTKLVASAGFGITLPLQLSLIAEVSRAASDSEAAIVNASYPDCVNAVLHRVGLRTTCGIGNAAIVEAFCRRHPKVQSRNGKSPKVKNSELKSEDIRVVAQHGHLGVWLKGERSASQPRVWAKSRELNSFSLRPNLKGITEELNGVTAATAISVIMPLLTGETLHASIPGVAGLPGGYPYVLKRGKFKLRLPPNVTTAEAVAHNRMGEHLDGLNLDSSSVKFADNARQSLASVNFEYAQGFNLSDWPKVCNKMLNLRNHLRSLPA